MSSGWFNPTETLRTTVLQREHRLQGNFSLSPPLFSHLPMPGTGARQCQCGACVCDPVYDKSRALCQLYQWQKPFLE